MIIDTLSSNPVVALELTRRIAMTEVRRRQRGDGWSVVWLRWFARSPAVKLIRAHA